VSHTTIVFEGGGACRVLKADSQSTEGYSPEGSVLPLVLMVSAFIAAEGTWRIGIRYRKIVKRFTAREGRRAELC
jgi:hypothetical protein